MKNIVSLLSDSKKEIDNIIKSKFENYLSEMNLINYEEYQTLKDIIHDLTERVKLLEEKIKS